MNSRRDFLKKALLVSGATGLGGAMPASIQRAFAINPHPGSTYMDAEHVVILMQENRSFDHCFGTLQGVRGFNDPRAITLPNKNPVWLQSNAAGQTFAPFRFDIHNTKATWIGCLPHGRGDQLDATNFGKHDKWLDVKGSFYPKYWGMPLTLGYHTREDVPFNYAMADAFTVCDQNFSSALTSTYPNRDFFMTGTIREEQNGESMANIRNENMDAAKLKWRTFPELLEENDISWKVYQNDLNYVGGFKGEERGWLSNLGCNNLEYFAKYNIKYFPRYVESLQKQTETLPVEISALQAKMASITSTDPGYKKLQADIKKKEAVLATAKEELVTWSRENYNKLSEKEKNLHQKAFTTNEGDPFFREITTLKYKDGDKEREAVIPKGDILHQFRQDVNKGELPVVSWLVSPQYLSDHPSAPWYGSLYVSEVLDVLTKNPEVWKKTIFILTYDENDGYFDHVPPFTAPNPLNSGTGKCSVGIDTDVEYIRRENEIKYGVGEKGAREGPIGLGYRVPMIIASPWSRGGQVCSQVFDHTSSLQFLEKFLSKKFKRDIKETNISDWRRAVCGDLTSAFSPYKGEHVTLPFLKKDAFYEKIHKTQFKKEPACQPLTEQDIQQVLNNPASAILPKQEEGVRMASAVPYQLYADGVLSKDKKSFEIKMEARNEVFGKKAAGSPFKIYAPGKYTALDNDKVQSDVSRSWNYAVKPGDGLTDKWSISAFEDERYLLRVYGPNGFFREFMGKSDEPHMAINCEYQRNRLNKNLLTGSIIVKIASLNPEKAYTVEIRDHGHKKTFNKKILTMPHLAKGELTVEIDPAKNFGWYDFSVRVLGVDHFERRYAGRVETGKNSYTDPAMGYLNNIEKG